MAPHSLCSGTPPTISRAGMLSSLTVFAVLCSTSIAFAPHRTTFGKKAVLHRPFPTLLGLPRSEPVTPLHANMDSFIHSYLQNRTSTDDDSSSFTHSIGIPMEDNHDLLLQLTSVQRAILYHCPALLDSCVMPILSRIPMMYLASPPSLLTSTEVSERLSLIVERTLLEGDDAALPLGLTFGGLEVDGKRNEALHAIGASADGRLTGLVKDLKAAFEEEGYAVRFPTDDGSSEWRPRVPFMRLPGGFFESLPEGEEEDGDWVDPEEGGNGISPLFWYDYSQDEFTPREDGPFGTRLRSVGVYQRSGAGGGLGERDFYAPATTIPLPEGDEECVNREKREVEDAEDRMRIAVKEMQGDYSESDPKEIPVNDYDDDDDDDDAVGTVEVIDEIETNTEIEIPPLSAVIRDYEGSTSFSTADQSQVFTPSSNQSTKFTKENGNDIINPVFQPINTPPEPAQKQPKDQESPIILKSMDAYLQKLKENKNKKETEIVTPTSPYPSDEHFIGVWRLVSSPHRNDPQIPDLPSDATENIILRVDGTVAGGPVLDFETRQKAAGGTWRIYQAQYVGAGSSEDDVPQTQIRLRISLVVPPAKNTELIMEGEVTRILLPGRRDGEACLHCSGEVWVQDFEGGREKLGRFTALQLEIPERKKLRYEVPPPMGNFFEKEEEA